MIHSIYLMILLVLTTHLNQIEPIDHTHLWYVFVSELITNTNNWNISLLNTLIIFSTNNVVEKIKNKNADFIVWRRYY